MPLQGIIRLDLSFYRCYAHLRLTCDTRPVVLTGANGAGKTNVLEALAFLSPGRSLRRAKLSEIIPQDNPEAAWAVAVDLQTSQGIMGLGTGLDPEASRLGQERRIVRVNGQTIKGQTKLSEYCQVLWLTPQMDRLFLDPASNRRRFLDRLVFSIDSSHGERVQKYEYAMRERSRLLKEGRFDGQWVSVLEANMAKEGIAIIKARANYLQELAQSMEGGSEAFPKAKFKLIGWFYEGSDEEAEEKLREGFRAQRHKDGVMGGAMQGPHRTDLEVRLSGSETKADQCSTGEQKALLITIIMAAARVRAMKKQGIPLLLLDEITAHLDPYRRSALYEEIIHLGIQVWMTGTEQKAFADLGNRAQFFQVENAQIVGGS